MLKKSRALGALILVLFFGLICRAQVANTFQVFPQIVDGQNDDGSYYISSLVVTNFSGSSSICNFANTGVPSSRFTASTSFTLPSTYTMVNSTTGTSPLATGFGTLSCGGPVIASVTYALIGANGAVEGMATVFPATAATYAQFGMLLGNPTGLRFGIAIANISSVPASATIKMLTPNGFLESVSINIPGESQYVKFIDELMSVPDVTGTGIIGIISTSDLYVTGLAYSGNVFTTLIPGTISN